MGEIVCFGIEVTAERIENHRVQGYLQGSFLAGHGLDGEPPGHITDDPRLVDIWYGEKVRLEGIVANIVLRDVFARGRLWHHLLSKIDAPKRDGGNPEREEYLPDHS